MMSRKYDQVWITHETCRYASAPDSSPYSGRPKSPAGLYGVQASIRVKTDFPTLASPTAADTLPPMFSRAPTAGIARPTLAQRRLRLARNAATALRKADPRLAGIIRRVGAFEPKRTHDPFAALFGSIVHQQISMSAARNIHMRLRALCPNRRLTPDAILDLTDAQLRAAGLSRQKVRYVRDLARHFADGRLTSRGLRRMSDEDVIQAVTQVKGVGRWTGEMLLIFCLERPDVWPVDDLGLREALRRLHGMKTPPTAKSASPLGEPYRPYRTVATWYLWRSLEKPVEPAISH
jgi:DNA-3-methyladenine glycosylase II